MADRAVERDESEGRSDTNRCAILVYVAGGNVDLTPLRHFRALATVGLDGFDAIENLGVLRELPSLRALSFRKSKLKDFSFLTELAALESLNLSQTRLSDLSVVSGLTMLSNPTLASSRCCTRTTTPSPISRRSPAWRT